MPLLPTCTSGDLGRWRQFQRWMMCGASASASFVVIVPVENRNLRKHSSRLPCPAACSFKLQKIPFPKKMFLFLPDQHLHRTIVLLYTARYSNFLTGTTEGPTTNDEMCGRSTVATDGVFVRQRRQYSFLKSVYPAHFEVATCACLTSRACSVSRYAFHPVDGTLPAGRT